MGLRVHELHPQLIHMPLLLLPSAAITDVVATVTDGPLLEKAGRTLWWATVAGASLAGLAGMAASQEVKVEDAQVRDTLFLHGIGNTVLLLGAVGLATYRTRRPPSVVTCAVGLAALGTALYTAYLGGELVYAHGVGVKKDVSDEELERLSPSLGSREAPGRLLGDALRGAGWLLGRAKRLFSGEESIEPGAFESKGERTALAAQASTAPVPRPSARP